MMLSLISRSTLILIIANLLTITGLGWLWHSKNATITELNEQIQAKDIAVALANSRIQICTLLTESQNESIKLLKDLGSKQETNVAEAVAESAKLQQDSISKVFTILNQKIPADCRGAMDHLKTTSKELSKW